MQGPSATDLAEARRIAAYGEPRGVLGHLFYALSVGPRRRTLRKELRKTAKKLEQAKRDVAQAHLDYGRRLHARASEMDLPSLRVAVGMVDHALLHQEGQKGDRRRRKRDRAAADQRVETALKKLAATAIEQELNDVDREGCARYRSAVHEAEQLDREVRLRTLGLDTYDPRAVRLGRIVLLVLVGFIAAAAASAWLSAGRP